MPTPESSLAALASAAQPTSKTFTGIEQKVPDNLEGKSFSIDESIDTDHEKTVSTPAKPSVEPKEGAKDKESPKEGDKTPAKTEVSTKPLVTPKVDPKVPIPRELLNEIDPDLAKILRQTPNEVYDRAKKPLKALLDEAKKAKEFAAKIAEYEAKPTHKSTDISPEAYILDPEYSKSSQMVSKADWEIGFFRQQLINIENNKPWQAIQGYDKDGRPVLTEAYQPNIESKVDLQSTLADLQRIKSEHQGKISSLKDTYVESYKGDEKIIEEENKKQFPWETDPKLLDEKVKVGEGQELSIKDVRKEFIKRIPKRFQSNIMSSVVANMFVHNLQLASKLLEAQSELERIKADNELSLKVEPASGDSSSDDGVTNGKVFVMDPEFQ